MSAPTPFETFTAGMFVGAVDAANGRDFRSYDDDELRSLFRDWLAERAVLAAARPTSLPEAPEPDLWARLRSASERVDRASKAWDRLAEPPDVDAEAEWKTAIGVLRLRVHSLLAATPSAPPVAVDPEAGAGERVWVPKAEFDALDEVLTGPAGEDGDADNGAVTYFAAQLVAAHRLANRPAAASGGDGEGTGNDG